MAIPQDIIQPLKDTLSSAQDVLVLLAQNAGQEMVMAGLGLYQALQEQGKNVYVACPTKLSDSVKSLPGGEQIASKLGNRNLVISLKVSQRDSIDKVSYNLDEAAKTFNLIIQPKKGNAPLKHTDVSYSYSGAQADVIFIIGANRLEDLGVFYEDERKLFTEAKTVSLHRFTTPTFADYQVIDSQTSGYAELAYELVQELNLSLTKAAASNFLNGLDVATNHLQNGNLKPDTLEHMAQLLRAGGQRHVPTSVPAPAVPVVNHNPAPANPVASTTPPQNGNVPQEWLAPKIYKSSTPKTNDN